MTETELMFAHRTHVEQSADGYVAFCGSCPWVRHTSFEFEAEDAAVKHEAAMVNRSS